MASLFVGQAAEKSKLYNLQYDEGGNHMAESRNRNRNEIHRNETKFTETKRNRCETKYIETKLTETKRNGIIQNEIKPILTKLFLGERQDKN